MTRDPPASGDPSPRHERATKSGRATKLLLSVAVFLATLLGLEGLCRVLGLGAEQEIAHYIANWSRQWQDDFYVIRPASKGVNEDGVRDRQHPVENELGLERVVFLGDSVTFGYGLSPGSSYPALLQRVATERGDPVEVFNVALPGWCTRQQRIAYDRIARKYRPDLVVVGLCLNDIPEMLNNLAQPARALAIAYRYSNLVRLVTGAHEREIHSVEELFEHPEAPSVRRGWDLTRAEILALADEVRADGARFALLVFPFRFQVVPGAPEPLPQKALVEFAAENGFQALDLLPVLLPLGEEAFLDYDHLSLQGVKSVARAILESGILTGG